MGKVTDLKPQPADPGQNIVTTLDLDIQYDVENLMKNKKGVILVGIAKSGEILAAVSSPDFRPDLFTGRMSENEWKNVLFHPEKPLINRFNQGLYPPGSIVKMITQSRLLQNQNFLTQVKFINVREIISLAIGFLVVGERVVTEI